MPNIFEETEHQELFYLDVDLYQPLAVHIPSALHAIGYYVCLRVPTTWADQFGDVAVHARLTGLHSTDTTARAGDGVTGPARHASRGVDLVWQVVCRLPMARGDGTLTFDGVPAGLPRVDLLLCTWRRFLETGQADDWLACQADPHWAPSGVPLGGIGTGRIDICRDGRFRNFSGNNNQDMPFEEPDGIPGAYLAVTAAGQERVLATRAANGIAPVPTLTADLVFPQATLTAADIVPGLTTKVTLSGTLAPHDLAASSLPAMLMRWRLENKSPHPLRVTCRFAWPNLVGTGGGVGRAERHTGTGDGSYRYWPPPAVPQATSFTLGSVRGIKYGNAPSAVCAAADGHHYVAVQECDGQAVVDAHSQRGSVAETVDVPAGGTATVRMALVWAMPHWVDALGVDRGLYWQNQFTNGRALVGHVFDHFDEMLGLAGALGALLRDTTLPEWLWRRLANCCYPLVTNSVLLRDGRFSINEGPTEMSGVYGTLDQRLGAHPATQLLFPALNRRELELFTATMTDNGEVNHDLGGGHLERGPVGQRWPDIQYSYVIQHARHAWSTGDAAFAAAAWPRVRRALERAGQWADAGGGVPQLGQQTGLGTSYDSYHYEGTTAYIATLWLAALQVARAWATAAGDLALVPQFDRWLTAAHDRLEADLWNGRYYRAFAGRDCPTNENCHAGMLAGEYFARMLTGEDVLPANRLEACAAALLERQGSSRFAVPPDEVAPDGREGSLYGWLPYIESFCLAPLLALGQPQAWPVWQRVVECMQGADRHPCDTRLMYRPVTGEPSWGAYYMTAPASWLVYDALLDFFYRPAEAVLRLQPQIEGRFAVVHPLFWGLGRRQGNEVALEVRRVFGREPLTVGHLELGQGVTAVVCQDRPAARAGSHGRYVRWAVEPVRLTPGAVLSFQAAPLPAPGVLPR